MIDRAWCAALVTAAGASSRMGRPKALVEFSGRALLASQLEALEGFALRIVVLGAHVDEIRSTLGSALDGVTVVFNDAWMTGRSSSLRAGFAAVPGQARAILVAGVDQPISLPVVSALLEAFDPAVHSHAVPVVGDRSGHPVLLNAILWDPHLLQLPDDSTLKDLLGTFAQSRIEVPVGDVLALANLNTVQDLARFTADPGPAGT